MRPIDADKLKKAIELLCEDERTNMTAIAYFALCELVDTMPTIEAEPVNGWISVEERLPEEDRTIHSYFVAIGDWVGVMVFYGGEFLEGVCGKKPDFPVHHWMPLPEPPEEDKDGKD